MSSNFAPWGTQVDIITLRKKFERLARFIQRNEVSNYKALITSLLSYVGALDTLIQASSSNQNLSATPTLAIKDTQNSTT